MAVCRERAAPDIVSAAACWCARNHFCRGGIVRTRFVSTTVLRNESRNSYGSLSPGQRSGVESRKKTKRVRCFTARRTLPSYTAAHRTGDRHTGLCGPKGSRKTPFAGLRAADRSLLRVRRVRADPKSPVWPACSRLPPIPNERCSPHPRIRSYAFGDKAQHVVHVRRQSIARKTAAIGTTLPDCLLRDESLDCLILEAFRAHPFRARAAPALFHLLHVKFFGVAHAKVECSGFALADLESSEPHTMNVEP